MSDSDSSQDLQHKRKAAALGNGAEDNSSNGQPPEKRHRSAAGDGIEDASKNRKMSDGEQSPARLPRIRYKLVTTVPLSELRSWKESLPFDVSVRQRVVPKDVEVRTNPRKPATAERKGKSAAAGTGGADSKAAPSKQPSKKKVVRLDDTYRPEEGLHHCSITRAVTLHSLAECRRAD